MGKLSELYQADYSAWAQRQAELLRAGEYAELDIDHLLQELSDMSKSDRQRAGEPVVGLDRALAKVAIPISIIVRALARVRWAKLARHHHRAAQAVGLAAPPVAGA